MLGRFGNLYQLPTLCSIQYADGNIDIKNGSSPILPVVSKKNAATQTSSDSSVLSSPNERPTNSSTSSIVREALPQSQSLEYEIRDVHVNDHVTLTSWPKKHAKKELCKYSTNIRKWKKKSTK